MSGIHPVQQQQQHREPCPPEWQPSWDSEATSCAKPLGLPAASSCATGPWNGLFFGVSSPRSPSRFTLRRTPGCLLTGSRVWILVNTECSCTQCDGQRGGVRAPPRRVLGERQRGVGSRGREMPGPQPNIAVSRLPGLQASGNAISHPFSAALSRKELVQSDQPPLEAPPTCMHRAGWRVPPMG